MKIAHLYPFLGRDKGGIAACLPPMLSALAEQNVECQLFSQRWPGDGELDFTSSEAPFEIVRAPVADRSGFGFSPALREAARASEGELFHSHGLWMYSDYLAFASAHRQGKPHVISPHGMLEPWALANSALKKSAMRRLFQDRALRGARCLHALCEAERQVMRALGLRNPIAVVPNGVNLEEFAHLPDAGALAEQFPVVKNRRVLLFMARLHPKKGLLPLLEAWRACADSATASDWLLVIAGPDEAGHRAVLETAVARLALEKRVLFTGMLDGPLKRAALARADAFVLPSFSEGFSIAVLEAMASRLPVVLTPECHFPDALAHGAALEAAPQVKALEQQLSVLLEMSEAQRAQMGARGHQLVARDYSWQRVASDLKSLYQWCIHGGDAPACVEISARTVSKSREF